MSYERPYRHDVRICRTETSSVPRRILLDIFIIIFAWTATFPHPCQSTIAHVSCFRTDVAYVSIWVWEAVVRKRVYVRDPACAGEGVSI